MVGWPNPHKGWSIIKIFVFKDKQRHIGFECSQFKLADCSIKLFTAYCQTAYWLCVHVLHALMINQPTLKNNAINYSTIKQTSYLTL